MGVGSLAGDMSEDGLLVGEIQYLGYLDIGLVPLEDEEASWGKDSEALRKALL